MVQADCLNACRANPVAAVAVPVMVVEMMVCMFKHSN